MKPLSLAATVLWVPLSRFPSRERHGSAFVVSRRSRMRLRLTQEQIDATIKRGPWFFLGGFALFVAGIFIGGYVLMTGLLGIMVGASIAGFGSGLFHRGMWFLAAVLWLPSLFIYATLSYLHIYDFLNLRGGVMDFVSLALATWLLGVQSRFMLTVTILNWQNSHKRFEHDHHDVQS